MTSLFDLPSWGEDPWPSTSTPAPPPAEPNEKTVEGLLELLEVQADLIIDVGTGGEPINNVNDKYKAQRKRLNAGLKIYHLSPPFPWSDLWEWYHYYGEHLSSYSSRRAHVSGLAKPIREHLERLLDNVQVTDMGTGPSTWAALDVRIQGVVTEFRNATSIDDLQDVGRRCREILIDAAKLLADPSLVPTGKEPPKSADAKGWLDLFLTARAAGADHKELRAFIRTAWDLAQKVTHGTVERVEAYAAAQATVLVVRSLQQLA